jgi:hypothetical protein
MNAQPYLMDACLDEGEVVCRGHVVADRDAKQYDDYGALSARRGRRAAAVNVKEIFTT